MQTSNSRRTIEEKKQMGLRMQNADGYTYSYGRGKFNRTKGFLPYVKRSKRADKRAWKQENLKRVLMEGK